MNKPLYRTILISAWRTTWNHKRLWFWGLFVGLLGNAGEYQFLVTALDRLSAGEIAPSATSGGAHFLSKTTLLFFFAANQPTRLALLFPSSHV